MKSFKLAGACALVLSLVSAARAGSPLDDRVPKDAIAYLGWAGSDALASQYAGSNLKSFVEATAMTRVLERQFTQLTDLAAQHDPQAPAIMEKWKTGLNIAWKHPCAFYFCPLDFSDPNGPDGRMGLVCDAGADAKTLTDLLNEAIKNGPTQNGQPVAHVTTDGTLVAIVAGKVENAAERARDGGLAANPDYIKTMAQLKMAKPAASFYVDAAKALSMAKEGIAKDPDVSAKDKAAWPAILDTLGLNGLTQTASAIGFDGKEWNEQTFVGMNPTRKGLVSLLAAAPLSDNALAAVPRDAVSFSTIKLDAHQVFSNIRATVEAASPAELPDFDASMTQITQKTGINVERDVLVTLGDEWIYYRAPLADVGGNSIVLVQKLRDGERFARTITQIEALVNDAGRGQFKIDHITASKIEFSSVSFLSYSLAWTVRNGYLYISTVDGLPAAVKQVENKLPSIAESDLYKKAMAALPQGQKPVSLSYSNPAKTYPELRRLALGLLPMLRANGVDLPPSLLPDGDDVAPFMTPGAGIAWADNDGLHMASHTAFPGAEVLGGNPGGGPTMVASVAVGTALALPAIAKARDSARRTVDAVNLKQIGMFCAIYEAQNAKYPDDLARLVADGTLDPRLLASPRLGKPPIVLTPELRKLATDDFAKFSAQIAAQSDYVYLGDGMSTAVARASAIIIAYDKPAPGLQGGINAAFLDGHVEFMNVRNLPESFNETNNYLKSQGRPEVNVDEILKTLGAK
ncbi:MAG TPA: DUF3352 domain-containing protein [Phycisphaerae bacterium]|nr:DUF3352 domain-containing protein [Phycisphaerae bacterium]